MVAAAGLALLSSCGSSTPPSAAPKTEGTLAPVQSGTVKISSRDNFFVPEQVTITVGSEVVWTNDGRNDHDVVPVEGTSFGVAIASFAPKAEYRHTFSEPGTYRYYCTIHGSTDKGMIGTVQVVAK